MKQLKALALALFAVLALAAVVASSASATEQGLPTVLPTAKGNKTDGISIGTPKYVLNNGNNVICEASSVGETEETESPKPLGTFHIKFKGCVGEQGGIKAKCTGLGDLVTGEILSLGTYHLVYDTGGTELGVAILFLVGATHFNCAGLFLNVTSGEQLCLIKEPYVEKTLHLFVCEGSKGVQSETYLNDKAETISPKLIVTEGEGATPSAAEEAVGLILWLDPTGKNVSTIIMMT
jgi:hypothetical protein